MKPSLKLAEAPAEHEPADNSNALLGDAEQEALADEISGALQSLMENEGPIKSALAWVDREVATTSKAVETSQTKIAAAHTAFDHTIAQATRDRDDIVAEATAKLQRDTRYLASATRFQGDLRQNES